MFEESVDAEVKIGTSSSETITFFAQIFVVILHEISKLLGKFCRIRFPDKADFVTV